LPLPLAVRGLGEGWRHGRRSGDRGYALLIIDLLAPASSTLLTGTAEGL